MTVVTEILKQMTSITKPQEKFLSPLFATIPVLRGRVNFLNLSRYADYSEKSFRRQFQKEFNFLDFNLRASRSAIASTSTQLIGQDTSFIPKSGQRTYGLDKFFNSCAGRAQRGLELSLLSLIDLERHTAYALSATQTAPALKESETRIDFYLQHLREARPHVPQQVTYGVFDGSFAKGKFVDGVCSLNLHLISKLRHDARVRYLYEGAQKKRGRRRRFDGKLSLGDLRRFESVGTVDECRHLYTAVVNSISLQRNIRVVVVDNRKEQEKPRLAVLFSTDTTLSAADIYRFYKARFQLEFLFRDAKQFRGLTDCQARDEKALHFQFNAALATVNLAKIEAPCQHRHDEPIVFSLSSWKQRYFNEQFLELIISRLELEPQMIKNHPQYEYLKDYGAIAA
jgi:Transposase DDE domain